MKSLSEKEQSQAEVIACLVKAGVNKTLAYKVFCILLENGCVKSDDFTEPLVLKQVQRVSPNIRKSKILKSIDEVALGLFASMDERMQTTEAKKNKIYYNYGRLSALSDRR